MEKNFVIEVEVNENERKNYLDKIRNLFLKKGFIVDREWEDNIEMSRPLSSETKDTTMIFPWIDKVYIQGKSGNVLINCSTKHFASFRYLILFVVPIVDILFLLFLFFYIPNRFVLVPFAVVMFTTNIIVYWILNTQFRKMLQLLAEEIQNLS